MPAEIAPNPLDPQELRTVMGHFATGVAVITAVDSGDRPIGFTCQSLVSVSLDPPLLSFCPAKTSTTWPLLRESGRLCINVLAAHQDLLCRQFSRSGTDKFEGVDWRRTGNGAPALTDALARIDVQVVDEHDAGDHTIAVVRVTAMEADHRAWPLLFFKGGFGTFG